MTSLFKNVLELCLIGLLFVLVSCGSSSKVTVPESEPPASMPRTDESFDPLMLQDEDLSFPEGNIGQASFDPGPIPAAGAVIDNEIAENEVVDGFRVQLFATKDIERATLEKNEAEFVFSQEGVAVYIEFDSPMYKVRVGDCSGRGPAEELRNVARRNGYPTAWIVKTKINTSPSLPHTVEEGIEGPQPR